MPKNDGRDGGAVVTWMTHPLSSDCVTRFLHLLTALNLENEAQWLKLCHAFPPAALQNCYLILTSLLPAPYHLTSFLALLCSGGKAAGQSTVLNGEGFHRCTAWQEDLGSFAPSCFQEVDFCFFSWDFLFFHQFVQLATVAFSTDHGSKERCSHKSGIHNKNKGVALSVTSQRYTYPTPRYVKFSPLNERSHWAF